MAPVAPPHSPKGLTRCVHPSRSLSGPPTNRNITRGLESRPLPTPPLVSRRQYSNVGMARASSVKCSRNCRVRLTVAVGILAEPDTVPRFLAHGSCRICVPGAIAPAVPAPGRVCVTFARRARSASAQPHSARSRSGLDAPFARVPQVSLIEVFDDRDRVTGGAPVPSRGWAGRRVAGRGRAGPSSGASRTAARCSP